MAIKQQMFNQVLGMSRDLSPSKRTSKLAYEIKNMRITIEEDNSLLSWTNEKGNRAISLDGDALSGTIVGTCVLNNYLVIFSAGATNSFIYRVDFSENSDDATCNKLYEGPLNLKAGSQIDAIAVYENEKVLKVYWVDNTGENQPRAINIADGGVRYSSGHSTQFDFLPTDSTTPTVTVEKNYETGYFTAGTILYAFAYYNLFGALTNLFYVTPILYINALGIGVETDKTVNCAFKINVKGVNNTEFNFLRIYAISRASTDTAPSARIVTDIDISKQGTTEITYVDRGDSGTAIDYTALLFLNNPAVIASTLDLKDNTLFLGNYKYDSIQDITVKNNIRGHEGSILAQISFNKIPIGEGDDDNLYYPYTNQLNKSSKDILGFKGGETYFFGFMLLDNFNRWTSIIPLGSKKNDTYPEVDKSGSKWITKIVQAELAGATVEIKKYIGAGFKNIKYVIVSKTEAQRTIICQGVLCPTVYSLEERFNGTIPFAQSSWFFRPIMKHSPYWYNNKLDGDKDLYRNDYNQYDGLVLEYRHLSALPHMSLNTADYKKAKANTSVEIQMNDWEKFSGDGYNLLVWEALTDETRNAKNLFGVDLSILTMHSPDIEFNSTALEILDRSNNYKFRIVGYTTVKNTVSDYNTEAELLEFMEIEKQKYTYKTVLNLNKQYNSINNKAYGLVSPWGVKTIEHLIDPEEEDGKTGYYTYTRIFPWHRSTSLNELPYKLSAGEKTLDWTVPLKTKVMSNLRVCAKTKYQTAKPLNISEISVFMPTTKLIKINNTLYLGINNEITYYGNVDTVLTSPKYTNYRWYLGAEFKLSDSDEIEYVPTIHLPAHMNMKSFEDTKNYMGDPIRMKYQSSPHAVFSILAGGALPYISGGSLNRYEDAELKYTPCWVERATAENSYIGEEIKEGFVHFFADSEDILTEYKDPTGSGATREFGSLSDYFFGPEWDTSDNTSSETVLEMRVKELYNYAKGSWATMSSTKLFTYLLVINGSKTSSSWEGNEWVLLLFEKPKTAGDPYTMRDASGFGFGFNVILNAKDKDDLSDYSFIRKNGVLQIYVPETSEEGTTSGPANTFNVIQDAYSIEDNDDAIFYIGEFYKDYTWETSEYALLNYNWLAASDAMPLNSSTIKGYGDTYFLRYDCLKTYAANTADPNLIVDIGSFMLETYVNIDGRYDRNRGLLSNLSIDNRNFNLLNKAYTLSDKFVQSYLSDKLFNVQDCPSSVMWTMTKTFGEDVDSWTLLTSTSILDMDGDRGSITKILNFNNDLLCFLKNGVSLILYNERSQIASTTGIPIELANSGKVDGKRYITRNIGCSNKESIATGTEAVYFIDLNTKAIHALNNLGIKNLSEGTFESYLNKWGYDQIFNIKTFFNKLNRDVYFINYADTDLMALTYNELLGQFISYYSYDAPFFNNVGNKCVSLKSNTIWEQNAGDYNKFYGVIPSTDVFHMTVVANGEDAITDKIWNNLEFRADSWSASGELLRTTFDILQVNNEYQQASVSLNNTVNSNYIPIHRNVSSNLRKKFRIWRALIPRNEGTRLRIRNPWTYIKLQMNNSSTNKTTLHDEIVYYFD